MLNTFSMADPEDERRVWEKIKTYIRENPQILYKGLPIGVMAYMSLPYVLVFYYWLPWMWAGYEIYNRIPGGSAFVLWNAIQMYLK